jgi:hypothetical protein
MKNAHHSPVEVRTMNVPNFQVCGGISTLKRSAIAPALRRPGRIAALVKIRQPVIEAG